MAGSSSEQLKMSQLSKEENSQIFEKSSIRTISTSRNSSGMDKKSQSQKTLSGRMSTSSHTKGVQGSRKVGEGGSNSCSQRSKLSQGKEEKKYSSSKKSKSMHFSSERKHTNTSVISQKDSVSNSSKSSFSSLPLSSKLSLYPSKHDDSISGDSDKKGVSSDEMRNKLFTSFRARGILGDVKSQLRTNLASVIHGQTLAFKVPNKHDGSILMQISDCMVAEHLRHAKYEYTLSVFKTESLIPSMKSSSFEILQLMNLNPSSALYQRLSKTFMEQKSSSFLWNFMSEVVLAHACSCASVECQTEPIRDDLDRNIQVINGQEGTQRSANLEERFIQLQRKLEAQKREELNTEKEQFKETYLREIRLQEQEKNKEEIDKFKSELEKGYKEMFDNSHRRGIEANELIARKQKSLESESYAKRQGLLEEMKQLRQKDLAMKQAHELAMKSVELQEAKTIAFAEELRVKQASMTTAEERNEFKLNGEIMKMKLELQSEQQKQEECLRLQERKLREEKALFDREKISVIKFKDDYEKMAMDKMQLQESLNTAAKKIAVLNQRLDDMKERLRGVSDYNEIKEKSLVLAKETEYLKTQLEELKSEKSSSYVQHKKDIKEIVKKFIKASPSTENLQNQLLKDKEEFEEKEKDLLSRCQRAEKRLHSEMVKNNELNKIYEECMLHQKALVRELTDLKSLRKKLPSYNEPTKYYHNPAAKSTKNFRNTNGTSFSLENQLLTSQSTENREYKKIPSTRSMDANARDIIGTTFLKENSDVFERLEREAAALERTYQNYQKKLERTGPISYGKPQTNEYIPLQKFYSTFTQRESLQTENNGASDHEGSEINGNVMLDTQKIKHQNRISFNDSIAAMSNSNSLDVKRNAIVDDRKLDELKETAPVPLVDTWTENHLTEQLLESAVNKKGEDMLQKELHGLPRNALMEDGVNTMDVILNASLKEDQASKNVSVVSKSEENLRKRLESFGGENNVFIHKTDMIDRNMKNDHLSSSLIRSEDIDLVSKDYTPSVENLQEVNQFYDKERKGEDSLDEESFKSIVGAWRQDLVVERDRNCQEYELEGAQIEQRDGSDRSREDPEKINTHSIEGDNFEGEQSDKTTLMSEKDNKLQEESEIDTIDPLMKHYMEMVLKQKGEERADNEINENEEASADVNLTDDVKIDSKKSDISDLLEDQIEEIGQDSDDEFAW